VKSSWDAVVVGAGPAGSIAARELARRGQRTLLVEKSHFPRAKVCGGCLNGNALATLNALGLGPIASSIDAVPLRDVDLANRGRRATIPLAEGMAINRSLFDVALVEEAIKSGVTFQSGVRAEIGEGNSDTRRITLRDRDQSSCIEARIVILATGLLGAKTPAKAGSRIGAGTILPDLPSDYRTHRIHMAMAEGGYVGLVRLGDGQADLAAAFDPAFIRKSGGVGRAAEVVLQSAGLPPVPDLSERVWQATPALTRRPDRIAGDRWFAVGDAAGYVEPFTGEGMAWAMAGAVRVAEIASRGVTNWSDRLIDEWSRSHARIVGRRQWSCRMLSRILRSPRACRWLVSSLAFAPLIAKPIVRILNRPTRAVRGLS
jgi:menaquinone-9 beta-reductase